MYLTRCQDQKSQTLEEFYMEMSHGDEDSVFPEVSRTMLDLIARLRALPDERRVYGLTSHDRLVLLAQDTYRSPWLVILSALDKRNYFVSYLLPERLAPWPHAYVNGEAQSEDEAVQMILTAMDKSEGWLKIE